MPPVHEPGLTLRAVHALQALAEYHVASVVQLVDDVADTLWIDAVRHVDEPVEQFDRVRCRVQMQRVPGDADHPALGIEPATTAMALLARLHGDPRRHGLRRRQRLTIVSSR